MFTENGEENESAQRAILISTEDQMCTHDER